jgi:hypothetical protein
MIIYCHVVVVLVWLNTVVKQMSSKDAGNAGDRNPAIWQSQQLSNTHGSSLNAKIRNEIEENEGSTAWSERRVCSTP